MYTEDDLLPLSALQHLLFCERQCALIHVEGLWADNRFTAEGAIQHERVHAVGGETRGDVRQATGMWLRSLRLGLIGRADVVEFHREQAVGPVASARPWLPFPVEHKRGRPKDVDCDRVQLCAQGMCLEEMLGVHVPAGALFYGKTRRRSEVLFTPGLRQQTEDAARRLHELVAAGRTPAAEASKKCESCSLKDLCLPRTCGRGRSARRYLARELESA